MSKKSSQVWAVRGVEDTTKTLFRMAAEATGKKVGELADEILEKEAERILTSTLFSAEDLEKYKERLRKTNKQKLQPI